MALMIEPEALLVPGCTDSSQAPELLQEVDIIDPPLLLLFLHVDLDPRRAMGELRGEDYFRPEDKEERHLACGPTRGRLDHPQRRG